ncbi:UNVERIFIED_CONTAM: hypothetical protein PYX00_011400 [Menopon gallinae]|uniref:DNA mismatch repair proteins mutS family domain-containing protein n=1 Tax=Menopon gallinae TaxID=328185 RepID=A0AAW2H7P9_9NEOP
MEDVVLHAEEPGQREPRFIHLDANTVETQKGTFKETAGQVVYIFDIDETLYPHDDGILDMRREKIIEFGMLYGLSREESMAKIKESLVKYKSTIKGFIRELPRNENVNRVLDNPVPNSTDTLKPDTELREMLLRLKGRRFCLTNGSREHSRKALVKIGVLDCIDAVFCCDYQNPEYISKPDPRVYDIVSQVLELDKASGVYFFDDHTENIECAVLFGWSCFQVTRCRPLKHILREQLDGCDGQSSGAEGSHAQSVCAMLEFDNLVTAQPLSRRSCGYWMLKGACLSRALGTQTRCPESTCTGPWCIPAGRLAADQRAFCTPMEFESFYRKLDGKCLKIFWRRDSYYLYEDDIFKVKSLVNVEEAVQGRGLRELRVSRDLGECIIKCALTELRMPVQEFVEQGSRFVLEREGLPGSWKDFEDICMDKAMEPAIAAVSLEGAEVDVALLIGRKIYRTGFEDDDIFTNLYSVFSEFNVIEVIFQNSRLERPLCNMGMIVHFYKVKESGSVPLLTSYLNMGDAAVAELPRGNAMSVTNDVIEALSIQSVLGLFAVCTDQGSRLLHKFAKSPLRSLSEIEKRQQHVEAFERLNLDMLQKLPDLARMARMIESRRISLENLQKLSQVICEIPRIVTSLGTKEDAGGAAWSSSIRDDFVTPLGSIHQNLQPLVLEIGRVIDNDAHINRNLSPELCRLREKKDEIQRQIGAEHERVLGLNRRIKVDKHAVFKISRSEYKYFDEDFRKHRFQELGFTKGGVTFTTRTLSELAAGLVEVDSEIEREERQIRSSLISFASEFLSLIEGLNYIIAYLDVLNAFSQKINENWTRPRFAASMKLVGAFHPLIRLNVIKNEIAIEDRRFVTITGPNMGGKSTFLKMCGVIALLAQMGSFVPASYCETVLFDSIWVRIGACDYASQGVSTFMAEMCDISKICHKATPKSLILIDELGRGTSALDGLCLALAIKEFLLEVGCITLFATHFPQVCGEDTMNKRVGIRNNVLTYLMEDGVCNASFGIENLSAGPAADLPLQHKSGPCGVAVYLHVPHQQTHVYRWLRPARVWSVSAWKDRRASAQGTRAQQKGKRKSARAATLPMDHTAQINKKISKKDGKAIETLFKTDKKKTRAILEATQVERLSYPFNKLLPLYYKESYAEAVGALGLISFDEQWATPIHKRVIHRLYMLADFNEDYSKVLMNTFRKIKDRRLYFYTVTMLISMYSKNKKYNMIDNLLSIVGEPDFVSKEAIVYYYYMGLSKLTRDDFEGSYAFLRKAFSYRFARERAALPLFANVILRNKRLRGSILPKYGVDFAFLHDIYHGRLDLGQLPNEALAEYNLLRVCRVYFPLISMRNLVYRVYGAARDDNRLYIRYLTAKTGMVAEECAAAVIQLITLGYIRGYLSINKQCIVLSRTDPFPSALQST